MQKPLESTDCVLALSAWGADLGLSLDCERGVAGAAGLVFDDRLILSSR